MMFFVVLCVHKNHNIMEQNEIPENHKELLRRKFEIAAEKGKWILYGGKIVIEVDRPKVGKPRTIKALTIIETVSEL